MYSSGDVHARFTGIPSTNADHFVAVHLDGIQWQYNNDSNWLNFEPTETDWLMAEVNFSGDFVSQQNGTPNWVEGIPRASVADDSWFTANRFGGVEDAGEFEVLGDYITFPDLDRTAFEQSATRLAQVALATHFFESVHQEFPDLANLDDNGAPLLSWRVHVLPFLGLEDLYSQFQLDQPWNSQHNLALADQMPEMYHSSNFDSVNKTVFLAMGGEGTIFPLTSQRIGFGNITDGSESTVMLVEANANRATLWTKPTDLYFDAANPLAGLGGISPEGFAVAMASGQTHILPATIDADNFANMAQMADGNVVDFSEFDPYEDSESNLRQLTLAALNYESANRRFPAHAIYPDTGEALLSWRVAILPFIEQKNLYEQFHLDESWESAHNLSLLPLMPRIYAHPLVEAGKTNFLGVSGADSIFDLTDQGVTIGSITDGSSNTAILVESDVDRAIEWTKPGDWVFDSASPKSGLGEIASDGFFASFADGSVAFVPDSVSDANVANMAQKQDAQFVDLSEVKPYADTETNLRQLGLAALNYESAYMRIPRHAIYSHTNPGGPPLLSWRVDLLPFIEQGALYDMFHHDEPWDSTHNLSLLPLMPRIFATPGTENGFTVYQAAVGEETLFPGTEDDRVGLGTITDGTSNTMMFMEATQAVEWTRPADISFDPATPRDGLNDPDRIGYYAVFADGSTHFVSDSVSDGDVGRLLQMRDGQSFETNDLRANYPNQARNGVISNQLRQIALAAHNYESSHGHFPVHAIYTEPPGQGGTPLLSWRVELLRFLEQGDLYDQFNLDEPWDSPHNLSLIPLMPDVFSHPFVENGKTVFQAFIGDNTIFPNSNDDTFSFGRITDGSSNTILFAEVNADQAVEWTKPQDIAFDIADPSFGFGDILFEMGGNVAMADGSVNFLAKCISDEHFAAMVQLNDGNEVPYDADSCDGTVTPPIN